ncbi:non-ribosomal peptide synthetase [Chromobacterium subtsugae]|uniref:non-ribosomal peptide synthetase n=1 Tax=Chromobacterium subtsugae TaxID=251747 RepID=UPI001364B457|nr:non-ribosomal peptide synthetase [Chromobacterium subtsugae]
MREPMPAREEAPPADAAWMPLRASADGVPRACDMTADDWLLAYDVDDQLADGGAPAAAGLESALREIWQSVLGVEGLSATDNFFAAGGDSIASVQLAAQARAKGIALSAQDLLRHQTIAALAASASQASLERQPSQGRLALRPAQLAALDGGAVSRRLLQVPEEMDERFLQAWLRALHAGHDTLRLRFARQGGEWRAEFRADADALAREARDGRAASSMQPQGDDGPALMAALEKGRDGARLWLSARQAAVDAASWRTILADLRAAFDEWRRRGAISARGAAGFGRYQEWCEKREGEPPQAAWPAAGGEWVFAPVAELDAARSAAMLEIGLRKHRARPEELLLAAALLAACRWSGERALTLRLAQDGRAADAELAATVGQFDVERGLTLALAAGELAPGAAILAAKEGCRAQTQELGDAGGTARLAFRYDGDFDAPAAARAGIARLALPNDDDDAGAPPLRLRGERRDGCLRLTLSCRAAAVPAQGLDALAARLDEALRELAEHCADPAQAASLSPSDFPGLGLTAAELAGWRQRFPALEQLSPATGMQIGMVFHSQLPGHADAYTNQAYLTLEGELDAGWFREAWRIVIERHPALRAGFVGFEREQPLQLAVAAPALDWREEDLRGQAPDAFERWRQADRQTPFDFGRPPLMRFLLARVGEQSHRFCWTHHHSIIDGWSVTLVWDEVFEAYRALRAGQEPALPPAPSFAEAAFWRHGQPREEGLRYWRETLAGIGPRAALRIEQPGLPPLGGEASKSRRRLSEQASRRLTEMARAGQTTLAATMQAAWALLLAHYSGQSDVVFGVTSAGRTIDLPGVERIVGPLINTVPARFALDPGARLGDWLRTVRDMHLLRDRHASIDLIDIQRQSGLRADQPLFDSVVIVDNYPAADYGAATGLRVSERGYAGETHYGLTLSVMPGARLAFDIEFDSSRFHKKDIDAMADKLESVLTRMPQNLAEPLSAAVGAAARAEAASDAAGLSMARRQGDLRLGRDLVPHLVENHAQDTPEQIALICNERSYSYEQLNRAANRLANHLLEQFPQLGADSLVGVRIPRGDKLVIAILALWKAGAAYIPLDPILPAQRVRDMLETAGAAFVIADRVEAAADNAAALGMRTVSYDAVEQLPGLDERNPDVHISGNDLSYVLYTSGSTGKPKGAMVEHIGMLNNIVNKAVDCKVTESSRVAQNASMSFDVSVWQMFIALARGGATVVYDDRAVNDVAGLLARLAADRVTVLEVVPTYLSVLVEHIEDKHPGGLELSVQYLLVTGETIEASLLKRWFKLFPHTQAVNAYGPTEASDDITHHLMSAGDALENPVPIGRALANFDVYIVDDELRPLPYGEMGEIVVTGVGVGRGYVGMAGATAQAFLDSPFPDKYRGRLYKTGDLGVMRPDGVLLYHGRKDKQVKIRGMRIELEDVELALQALPAVRQAAVLEIRPAGREAFLCAFAVARADGEREAIVAELKEKLPPYMVPSVFRFESELPQLPSGKIDRRALLARYEETAPRAACVEPTNEVERRLADIWREVIGSQAIGIGDDFFDVGGDSFKAIRIAAKYGAPLEVTHLYDYPTIAALAEHLAGLDGDAQKTLTPIAGDPAQAEAMLLCIANSGGGPVSFIEMGRAFSAAGAPLAACAVNLPRNEVDDDAAMVAEVERLAAEVCDELGRMSSLPLMVFAQCNGSALALGVVREWKRRGADLRALCIGGALLRTEPTPKDVRSDEQIVAFLGSIGSTLPAEADERAFFLHDFSYDCHMADSYYNHLVRERAAEAGERIGAPVFCLVGTEDPIVSGYAERYRDWGLLSDEVSLIEYPGIGHYLLRDCPAELAASLADIWRRVGGKEARNGR